MMTGCWIIKECCSNTWVCGAHRRLCKTGFTDRAACAIPAVIVDYHMPEMNGHVVATEIKRLTPQIPIVMRSSDEEIPAGALKAVDAFVSKNDAPACLLPVITRVCAEIPSEF